MAVKPLVVTFGVSEIMDGGPVMSSVLRASAVGEAVVLHTALSVAGKARSPSLPSCRSDAAAHAIVSMRHGVRARPSAKSQQTSQRLVEGSVLYLPRG